MEGKWKTAQSSDQTLSWRPLHWSAHGVNLLTEALTSFCSILIYCQKERFWDRGEVCKSWMLSLPPSDRMWMLERRSRKGLRTLRKFFKTFQKKLGHVGRQAIRPTCVLRLQVYSLILQVSKYILITHVQRHARFCTTCSLWGCPYIFDEFTLRFWPLSKFALRFWPLWP